MPLNSAEFGNSEVGSLISDRDRFSSALGPPEDWPQELRTVVSLILNSKFPMFVAWGPELTFLYNDASRAMLGNRHPAALGKPFRAVWPEIWDEIFPLVERALAGEASYFEDMPLVIERRGFEEQAYFTFSYSPLYCGGKVAGMYCACTETTKQVFARRQRTDENDRLHALFHQAPGVIAVLRHSDHVFELANDAYCELVGRRDIVGKPLREALPEVESQGFVDLVDQVYSSGEPYRGFAVPIRLRRRGDGPLELRYVDFIYQPIRESNGRISGIFIEGADVTEAVLTTQALRDSERRLRQLANTIPQLAWMANADGSIHWFNDRFYEYSGRNFEEVEGWKWLEQLLPPDSADIAEEFRNLFASAEAFELTAPLRAADGEYRMFYTKAAPLHDSAGRIVQWFGTNTDINEIERVQEELLEASRRKDEFLAMLAHELRNPLAPISTAAELLKRPNLDRDRIRATSLIIARQVEHMTKLVDDLLDVSRVTRGLVNLHREAVDVRTVVRGAVEQVRNQADAKQQTVEVTLPDEALMVEGDRTRLVQIFSNILNNAVRYTAPEGRIELSAQASTEQVYVRIRDNGIGIEPHLLPHIFELFTQAERSPDRSLGGLGLGLALVKSLVTLHEGTVSARSEGSGRGSQFTVCLPRLFLAAPAPRQPAPERRPGSVPHQRIMVVDDNQDAAQSLAQLLELQGYRTMACYGASEALSRASTFKPQVMVLDIGLPDMDGYQLARRLRANPATTDALLIALTGYGQVQDRQQSRAAGFDHHLVKPANIERLLALLAQSHRS